MWGGDGTSGGGGGGVSSSQLAGMLIGYATETWVDEHYISIDFFSRLFQAHGTDNGSEIDVIPNDMETTITSVESMFGFWTNLYISALGSNGAAPAGISLGMLTDVNISGTPSADQVLTFDAATQKWVNSNAQAGATALANLTDVQITSPQTNQVLIYDYTTSKWLNSQLKTVNGYSLIGSGNIDASGGGSGNYVAKAGDTMTGVLNFNLGSGYAIAFPQYYIGFNINNDFFFYTTNNISFAIWTAGEKRIKVTGNGNVGINNENPAFPLDVVGYSKSQLCLFRSLSGGELGYVGRGQDNDSVNIVNYTSGIIDFWVQGSQKVIIRGSGNLLDVLGNARIANNLYFYDGTYMDIDGNIHQTVSNAMWVIFSHAGAYNFVVRSGDGFVGIGTSAPSYKLHVAGTIYATGSITALSDARKKDITGDVGVTVEQIAHAPAVQFLWKDKDRRKDGQQVGTLAQYWRTVLPEVVSDKGGELSMQYGVAALVSSIIIARKVANHEVRIDKMEKWMKKWAEENDE